MNHMRGLNRRAIDFSKAPLYVAHNEETIFRLADEKFTAFICGRFMGSDAIHGAGFLEGATLFPHVIGVAASFNTSLAFDVAFATAIGTIINFSRGL